MGPKKPPPAGSDSGLWPPQGQSRFFEPINPFSNSSLIQIQRIEFFLSTKLFSAKVIHSGGKVGFRFPTIPFLYPEYKIRNISIFYSLEFYFSQRAGEERISLHRPGLTMAYGLRRDISRVWANRGAERRMGATHHLVLNVRFRESKSTVKVKSVFRHHPFPSLP